MFSETTFFCLQGTPLALQTTPVPGGSCFGVVCHSQWLLETFECWLPADVATENYFFSYWTDGIGTNYLGVLLQGQARIVLSSTSNKPTLALNFEHVHH